MYTTQKKYWIYWSFLAVALISTGGIFFFSSQGFFSQKSETYVIQLTEDGFSPSRLTIRKGDTVLFTTTREKPFWPASDLHPTHGIYPEFDPKEPINPDASWRFRFDKAGEWRYHDHLAPLFRGVIKVTEGTLPEADAGAARESMEECNAKLNYGDKAKCWQDVIVSALKEKGIDASFALIAVAADKDAQFAADCHGLSHELGREAYTLFSQGKEMKLSAKTSYCAYGFYHGFMEALLHATGDAGRAREFCEYVGQTLAGETSDGRGACLHGIGHGAVEDEPDPASRGNAAAIIAPSLKICERVASGNSQDLFRCASGVFNALEIISTAGKYGLSLNDKDPFLICRGVPDAYRRACYTQFLVAAMNVAHGDFVQTAGFIDTIPEDAYAKETLAGLVVERVHTGKTDYKETIALCRSLTSRFRMSCITGFGEGFLKYGPPGKEYVRAVDFCGSALLTDNERGSCFGRILSILRIWYTADKSKEICESADARYRGGCNYY